MKKIIFLILSLLIYSSELGAQSKETADNSSGMANEAIQGADNSSSGKKKIREKLVPDEEINDRNSFMERFGFKEEQLFDENQLSIDLLKSKNRQFRPRNLVMENSIQTENIWGKDKMIIEASLLGGVMSHNTFSVKANVADLEWTAIPYGGIHIKFGSGGMLMPEFYMIESGNFKFDRNNLQIKRGIPAYNEYFLKIPTGIKIPFFGWKSNIILDGLYSNLYSNYKVKNNTMVNGVSMQNGSNVYSAGSEWTVRLYLETPVVRKPSISEYSYFGIYYDEHISARSATPGSSYLGYPNLLVSANTRSGGIFYDMKKDVYKGFTFGISVYGGYAEIEAYDASMPFNVEYNNIHGLLSLKGRLTFGYQHIFKNTGIGLSFEAGAGYKGELEFIFASKTDKYRLGLEGEIRYFGELKILFGH